MEKGNEGDEIIFLSLRQIECAIPQEVVKVGQITADLLVEIIARSLLLISDGEIKFPVALPQNIASRHRICTSIATKIKELGFLSDCGYNQLLYPVENQTRELLKWLVEKLPRSEEEGAQEVLGANALMNRRIMQSLKAWKHQPLSLPFCSKGRVLRKVYDHRQFRTIPGLLEKRSNEEPDVKTIAIFQRAAESKISVEASLFERHALEQVADATYALRLERDFAEAEAAAAEDADGLGGDSASGESKRADKKAGGLTQKAIRAALLKAVKGNQYNPAGDDKAQGGSAWSGADGAGGAAGATGSGGRGQPAGTLQDMLQSITDDFQSAHGGKHGEGAGERGTRFSHAMEFAQEATATKALAAAISSGTDASGRPLSGPGAASFITSGGAGGSSAGGAGAGAGADGHDASGVLSMEGGDGADGGAGAGGAGGVGGKGPSKANPRRNHQELEELARQEELDALRSEVQQYGTTVETMVRNQTNADNRTKQYEADLVSLLEETERVEKEVLLKRKTLEMLPSARDNISRLQEMSTAGTQRLLELAQEWDKHRQPMVEMQNEKEDLLNKRREKGRYMVEEVKRYRTEMAAMVQDLKDKQDRMQILNEEKSKLNKNINRAMYTHRIMDITNQIVKQNKDIDKITADIRDIQKTINLNSSTLQRADAVTEELIFAAANDKNDPVMVDTYRRLKTLRAKFEELIGTVGKIGQQEKAVRDLETKIDQEQARVSANNIERIKGDLDAIAKENAQLVAQIKAASAGKHK